VCVCVCVCVKYNTEYHLCSPVSLTQHFQKKLVSNP